MSDSFILESNCKNGSRRKVDRGHRVSFFVLIPLLVRQVITPCTRAGVTGLQTSISLRQAGYQVVLLAKHFPGEQSIEYTSPWYVPTTLIHTAKTLNEPSGITIMRRVSNFSNRAGAHWRSHAGKADLEQQQWDTETYKHMLDVIEKEGSEPDPSSLSGLAVC